MKDTPPPSPMQAAVALKSWLPAMVAILAAGAGAIHYLNTKADVSKLEDLASDLEGLTKKLTDVELALVRISSKSEVQDEVKKSIAAAVRQELAELKAAPRPLTEPAGPNAAHVEAPQPTNSGVASSPARGLK